MASQNQYDAGVAMTGLSVFITADLARDLANDVMNLVRALCSCCCFQKNPVQFCELMFIKKYLKRSCESIFNTFV